MTHATSHPISERTTAATTEETLRLKCPGCGGGLNLKRRHLGMSGQCVHCHRPLRAVESDGVVQVFDGGSAPEATPTSAPAVQAEPAPPVVEEKAPHHAPCSPLPSELAPPPPSREADNLFSEKFDFASPPIASLPTSDEGPSPFGEKAASPSLFTSLSDSGELSSPVSAGWGTRVPNDTHASISPFGTGSASFGGGFADNLFREKVVRDSTEATGPAVTSSAASAPTAQTGAMTELSSALKRDCQERVILDGDGRPMRPMTKEEEESFATNFFKYENARSTPRWVKRLRKMAIRALFLFCFLGFAVGGLVVFTPKEKLAEWKTKAIDWLEPGMAILDYLPEGLRPDWLPRTEFGIDAGVDENGQPKKKLNAFEGLEKLKGDVGNMRGAADAQLEELKNF